jgi:TRAP transporter TAXI family solute receptor
MKKLSVSLSSWCLVAGLLALGVMPLAQGQTRLVTIATGSTQGVYYAAGSGVCRLMNRDRAATGLRCLSDITQGSVANVDALARNSANFAIVQSDVHLQSVKGVPPFDRNGLQGELRSVFSLHSELFTVLAGPASSAKTLAALKSARVARGIPGSGVRASSDAVLALAGWSAADGAGATERVVDEQAYALCESKLDAMAMVIGHPSAIVARSVKDCGAALVALDAGLVQKVLESDRGWVAGTIPAGTYANQREALASVGPIATMLTVASVPDAVVYAMVKAVFDNLAEFKEFHPVLSPLDPQRMAKDGLFAPLHPGAARYFKERGWL